MILWPRSNYQILWNSWPSIYHSDHISCHIAPHYYPHCYHWTIVSVHNLLLRINTSLWCRWFCSVKKIHWVSARMPGVKGGCVEGLLSLSFFNIHEFFCDWKNLDRLMMNATTKLGVLCRMQPIHPSTTHIILQWVKEPNLPPFQSVVYTCAYIPWIFVLFIFTQSTKSSFSWNLLPIILELNIRDLGNIIKMLSEVMIYISELGLNWILLSSVRSFMLVPRI